MERWIAGTVVVLFVGALLVFMFRAWARRRRTQDAEFPLPTVPATVSGDAFDTQFVAVTRAGRPLERITAGGLGYRGRATVTVAHGDAAGGLLLEVDGAHPLWLAGADLRSVGRGTWTIDRVVESGGLAVVTAEWNGVDVDVYLGPQFAPAATAFIAAVESLLAAHPDPTPAPGAAA